MCGADRGEKASKSTNSQNFTKVHNRKKITLHIIILIREVRKKCGLLSKKLKFNFGTEKISLDEQYILGSDSGQLETRTVNALFVEMQHMEQYCCEISEGQ